MQTIIVMLGVALGFCLAMAISRYLKRLYRISTMYTAIAAGLVLLMILAASLG